LHSNTRHAWIPGEFNQGPQSQNPNPDNTGMLPEKRSGNKNKHKLVSKRKGLTNAK
jgi:hypothetical protein